MFVQEEGKGVPLLCELNSDDPPVTRNQLRIFTFLTVICEKPGLSHILFIYWLLKVDDTIIYFNKSLQEFTIISLTVSRIPIRDHNFLFFLIGFGNTMDKMLQLLFTSFFGSGRMFNMTMSNILSLARVLVLCSRYVL